MTLETKTWNWNTLRRILRSCSPNQHSEVMKNSAVDDILLSLNWWGRYEKIQFAVLMFPVLPSALHIVSVVFIGRPAEHSCAPFQDSLNHFDGDSSYKLNSANSIINSNNNNHHLSNFSSDLDILVSGQSSHFSLSNETSITYGMCSIEVRDNSGQLVSSTECPNGYHYAEPRDRTFVSEWDLVCEYDAMSDLSQTIMGVGMMVGAFGFSYLSDRCGRKKAYIIADVLLLLLAVATAFAPNFVIFSVLRFLTGVAQQGTGLISFVLMMEQLPTAYRSMPCRVGMFTWALSLLSVSLFAYLTKDVSWRYTQLALAACSLYVLGQYWLVDDSLRWLLANYKMDEAEKVIRKAARQNGVNVQTVMKIFREKTQPILLPMKPTTQCEEEPKKLLGGSNVDNENDIQNTLVPEENSEELGFFAVFRDTRVLKVTAIACYMWFADSATYFGLIMTSGSLVNDLYLGYAVNTFVEIPSAVAFFLLTNRVGRKTCTIIFHVIAGLALLVAVALNTISAAQLIPGVKILVVVISLIGKFGSAAGYGMLWLYTPELFPTNIRTTGFGLASLAARIGVIMAPFSRTLGSHLPWAPGVIFGVLCLLIPVLTLLLPETHGRELPQTVEEMERQKKTTRTEKK